MIHNITPICDILGEENVQKVKDRIANLIVDRIAADLQDYDKFIFYPPDYYDFFDECFEEAKKRVKEKIISKLEETMMDAYKEAKNGK